MSGIGDKFEELKGKPGAGDDPSKGRGRGKGLVRMGVCQLQETRVKYKVLPAHAAMKMIASGQATAAPNGPADCEVLDASIVEGEE
jgi:hypothetical protein